jgi:diguanylate cyclase (GGDEF)-like protein/PAS domain S-box-containing protein
MGSPQAGRDSNASWEGPLYMAARILIADDHEMIRRGIRSLLEFRHDIEVSEASDGKEAVEKTVALNPDLVILDISMPLLDGLSAAKEIRKAAPGTAILILTLQNTDTLRDEAEKIGVSGFLTKGEDGNALLRAIGAAIGDSGEQKSSNAWYGQRSRVEKKIQHWEAHYRALMGNVSFGICRCGMEGQFLDVNQALVTMLGYGSKEELLAVNLIADLLRDPSQRAQLLGEVGENRRIDPLEIGWSRKDGASLKVRLSGRGINTDEGKTDGYEIIVEDVTKQRELEDHLRWQAARDPLTGLANYRYLVEVLETEIRRSKRTGREFALLLFDLDGLKQINDRYGHVTGSEALCRLAQALTSGCRDVDTPARFGGDEFAVVLPETGAESARFVAQRLCDNLASDGNIPKLSVSVGVAVYPRDGEAIETLLVAADMALYGMKARVHGTALLIQ